MQGSEWNPLCCPQSMGFWQSWWKKMFPSVSFNSYQTASHCSSHCEWGPEARECQFSQWTQQSLVLRAFWEGTEHTVKDKVKCKGYRTIDTLELLVCLAICYSQKFKHKILKIDTLFKIMTDLNTTANNITHPPIHISKGFHERKGMDDWCKLLAGMGTMPSHIDSLWWSG